LAKSIAEHGLNPTESWAIVQEEGKYVVLEGNRRLVACRLLDNPRKAPDPQTVATFERIKRGVRTTSSYLNPSCVEFEHRADARYWIHLKHHGAGSGEGTAAWGPEMVYLDQVNSGSAPVEWNEFWYWLEETYQHDHPLVDLIDQARREQYTLMERVYTWKVKELLGASFTQPGQISIGIDPDKIKPFIHKLITGMLTPQPKDPKAPGAADILVISSRTLNSRDVAEETIEKPVFGCSIDTREGIFAWGLHGLDDGFQPERIEPGEGTVDISIPAMMLRPGAYLISASIQPWQLSSVIDAYQKATAFDIIPGPRMESGGLVALGAHYERIDPPRPMVTLTKDD